MKRYFNKISSILTLGIVFSLFAFLSSCEQTSYAPNMSTAPGGGTVNTFKAYTLAAADAGNVYGRVVFYRYNKTVTLVQLGLYNGVKGSSYTAAILPGKVTDAPAAALKTLDTVNGETGEFATSKYFTISEEGFYDKLDTYNANVVVKSGAATIASGNVGANAAPVQKAD